MGPKLLLFFLAPLLALAQNAQGPVARLTSTPGACTAQSPAFGIYSGWIYMCDGSNYVAWSNTPAIAVSNPSRSLNACFQPSATKAVSVTYSVSVGADIALVAGGANGTAYLETFTDSGCTTGTVELGRVGSGLTGAVVLGVAIGNPFISQLHGLVAAGLYVKIRTQNNSGTPSFSLVRSQEAVFN